MGRVRARPPSPLLRSSLVWISHAVDGVLHRCAGSWSFGDFGIHWGIRCNSPSIGTACQPTRFSCEPILFWLASYKCEKRNVTPVCVASRSERSTDCMLNKTSLRAPPSPSYRLGHNNTNGIWGWLTPKRVGFALIPPPAPERCIFRTFQDTERCVLST